MKTTYLKKSVFVLGLASLPCWVQALQLISLTPQGEVRQVRKVVAKFDQNAVNFGDPNAPAPLQVQCNDAQATQTTQGSGRWLSAREWAYEFADDLPSGVRCSVQAKAGFQSPKGESLSLRGALQFNTGGPFVRLASPRIEKIEEDQVFLLQLNGAATLASAQQNIWCEADGLGERIPVKLIDGSVRNAILQSHNLLKSAEKEPLKYLTLTCNRRLSPGAKVNLVYGKGVASPQGLANTVEKRFKFTVREPFLASFSCERENARAACMPLRPLSLSFNAPITRKQAAGIRLQSDKTSYAPKLAEGDTLVDAVQFETILPERTAFKIVLPSQFQDVSGRALANLNEFPLVVATGPMPPLAKFAAAPFGILERFAEPDGVAMMPLTVRQVEAHLNLRGMHKGAGQKAVDSTPTGQVSELVVKTDADIMRWYAKVLRYHRDSIERKVAASELRGTLPPIVRREPVGSRSETRVETRALSLLAGEAGVRTLNLPQSDQPDGRPFEVVGIPLKPGFHVLEIASQKLGSALLDEGYGAQRTMYVRTAALVTNLGVHFKLGRENALAWVTRLDKGKPVANARVRVSDCRGKTLASATTNALGVATFTGLASQPPRCTGKMRSDATAEVAEEAEYDSEDSGTGAYFVSARHTDSSGVEDMAFTFSTWQRGIEPWRFNVPMSRNPLPSKVAHTIFDRTLFRAGETVSMKHLIRTLVQQGFGLPNKMPNELVIRHAGSGQEFKQALVWRNTPSGGRSAENSFTIPAMAKLGEYDVRLVGSDYERYYTGSFRVEEFRLPVFTGSVTPVLKQDLVRLTELPVQVQINYVAGGPAANLPVKVSALLRQKTLSFNDYSDFLFEAPSQESTKDGSKALGEDDEGGSHPREQRVVADKLVMRLDKNGTGKINLEKLPQSQRAQELLIEASYADPNGEIQTLRHTVPLWPAAVVAGIKTEGWVSAKQEVKFQALALNLAGKPLADVPLEVRAVAHLTTSNRKRVVGGFYSYDNQTESKDLGILCSGKSDARGLLLCRAKLGVPGQVELIVSAKDSSGKHAQAASSIYVTKQGELWFGGEDHDRIDVLPEKKAYQAGETAKFQVRMPFRFATALLTVEREGILESQVLELSGEDPTVKIKVKEGWGPNVYVSVLVLRGRLREVPWYSFFTWGYKAPREWWSAFWYEGREYVAPSALVDLSKPAYRLGLAEIRVGTRNHEMDVKVNADQERYPVRGAAKVTISAKLPDGRPAANAEVALVAVDQALLELMPNASWNLLDAMLQRRDWGVETSTAHMEIVGRRHYGRKAVPAGGGGGHSNTRELFDTLLLWQPKVVLDANGQATVTVRLNDALTSFRIVAVADLGTGYFGQGQTTIKATQDLQLISGLPPLVREGDQYRAQVSLRNTTAQAMQVEVLAQAIGLNLPAQTLEIPANEAREASWLVTAPEVSAGALGWEISARALRGTAKDALKVTQKVIPALPLTVQQGILVQVDGIFNLPVQAPAEALPGKGGLRMHLVPKLAEGLPGVRDWFLNYPYSCLEQKSSKALGLRDVAMWRNVVAQMPNYLDSDGLANYFPPRADADNQGSDTLTAYLLAISHEASSLNQAYALPDAVREPMLRGLSNFVEGRLQRKFWSPQEDLEVRKLSALEALSRYGKAQGKMLSSLSISPNQWPTHAVLDWLAVLERVTDIPNRDKRIAEARQILRARLSYQGTKIVLGNEQADNWWWLMSSGDVNAARLMLAAMGDASWKEEMGRLAAGLIARQARGAWATTTANAWGSLALEKFSQRFETVPVSGQTSATLAAQSAQLDWAKVLRPAANPSPHASPNGTTATTFGFGSASVNSAPTLFLPWPKAGGAGKENLRVVHSGSGKPWLTVQALAAVRLKAPMHAGYQIKKTITPIETARAGQYSRGDVLRVSLEINASATMRWVVLSDPIPGGASILGGGLGRDSEIATRDEKSGGVAWAEFEERSFEAYRSYFSYLPKGRSKLEYTVRLNSVGDFAMPPTRVEAMYAPEMFGASPNPRMQIQAGP